MARVGYIRVSTEQQNSDRQLDDILSTLDKIFTEKQSGKSIDERLVLQQCYEYVREGDILYVHSIDRLARNLSDLQMLVSRINAKGVTVIFYKENLTFTSDGNSPMSVLMLQMLGSFAEFERVMIKERQREGITKAMSKGVKFGAKPKFTNEQIENIKSRRSNGESVISIANEFNVSRQTIYSILSK
jgi:DNA invertase Pin-like site-specific DNA recombinase